MFKTLNKRLVVFLIIPVALFLFLTGFFGFLYAKGIMLDEWREAAILKMQRAAHHIDMRLNRPIEWITMFHKTSGYRGDFAIQEWLINQLKELEGVIKVNLEWFEDRLEHVPMMSQGHHTVRRGKMRFHRARISEITPPRYDAQTGKETVKLISDLKDESESLVGRLEVTLRFDYLMQDIIRLGWWQSELACLVDQSGRYLAHSKAMEGRAQLGETNDPVELGVLEYMKEKTFGTYFGSGHPPDLVSGFYRLKQAPWLIVMFAPGEKILSPIVKFRLYYTITGILCIAFILMLIKFVGGKMVRSIGEISQAAEQVAKGNYGNALPIKTADEVGQLTQSFNAMVEGLKERDFISNTFGRYVDQEIARELIKRPEASSLGGEKREVAILMSDIRGFTLVSESLSPEKIISLLNHYFSHMIEVIQKHQGIIVDFFGDGVLVFFDPFDGPIKSTVHRATQCALEMQNEMKAFNTEMGEETLPQLEMGIGVNAGEVVVGNIGSEIRAKYGIVGSAVNITQRIQSKAKGGEVVISESVYHHLSEEVAIKRSLSTSLKGIQGEIKLFVMNGN
jgi:class 3 adenylate cyclase